MPNEEHLNMLRQGVSAWNAWRSSTTEWKTDDNGVRTGVGSQLVDADLSGADLTYAKLEGVDFGGVNLEKANLSGANLWSATLDVSRLAGANLSNALLVNARLRGANLNGADLSWALLEGADLQNATLCGADLTSANLREADLVNADLSNAILFKAKLMHANLRGADLSAADLRDADLSMTNLVQACVIASKLTGARVYGASVWDVKTDRETAETGLIITPDDEPIAMVDNLELSQFIYLLLNREKIATAVDAVTRKGVLILGRFGSGGLELLQAIATWLRKPENGGYLPLLFDFPRPKSKTYTETVRTLVGLSRFVIVELSGPSVPQEITATVDLYKIPFVPIIERKRKEWSMFKDFLTKDNVLKQKPELTPLRFESQGHLLELLADEVIAPAERFVETRQKLIDKIFGRT